jgi:hypothetical protein
MKRSILRCMTIGLVLVMFIGCSTNKLDEAAAKNTVMRFVNDEKYFGKDTPVVTYMGPITLTDDGATIDFNITFTMSLSKSVPAQEYQQNLVATFNRTQKGKWILTNVSGEHWSGTASGELNWEVK